MRKAITITGIVVVVIVAALLIVVANLNRIVNGKKDFFLAKAETAVGREVTIERIRVSLRGGVGVQLVNVTLADDPSFSSEPFLEAASVQLDAKLLPLLRKQFELKRVVLREPLVRLVRNEEGVLNAHTFRKSEQASAGGSVVYLAQQTPAPTPVTAPLEIALLDIDRGTVTIEDRSTGVELALTQIRSRVEDLDLEEPISLTLEAALLADAPNLQVNATVGPVTGGDPRAMPVEASVKLDPVDVKTLMATLPALADSLPSGLEADGPLALGAELKGTAGNLGVALHLDATALDVTMDKSFTKAANVPLTLDGNLQLQDKKTVIEDTRLRFHKLEAVVSGSIATGEEAGANITVVSKPTAMDGWEELFPALAELSPGGTLELTANIKRAAGDARPDVTGTASITGGRARAKTLPKPLTDIEADITFTDKTAEVRRAALAIGTSRLEGTAKITSFEPMTVSYRASSPALALADVKPPNPKARKPEVMKELVVRGDLVATAEPTGSGRLTSLGGRFGNFDYEHLKTDFAIEGKKTRFENLELRMLDGTLRGKGTFTSDEKSPSFNIESSAQGINVAKLVEAMPDVTKQVISGRASLDVDLAGSGKQWTDIQPTLSGGGLAVMLEGALLDFNVFDSIVQQITRSTGVSNLISNRVRQKYPKVFDDTNTSFKELKSDFKVENGRLLARNLKLDAGDYLLSGKGGIGLDKSLDMVVTLSVSKALSADLIKDVDLVKYLANDNGQVVIPFALRGTMPNVTAVPDQAYINGVIQKALVRKGVDQLGDNLQKGIGDLLKKRPTAPADTTR